MVTQARKRIDHMQEKVRQAALERDRKLLVRFEDGVTQTQLAREEGVTRQRIGQIIERARGVRLLEEEGRRMEQEG